MVHLVHPDGSPGKHVPGTENPLGRSPFISGHMLPHRQFRGRSQYPNEIERLYSKIDIQVAQHVDIIEYLNSIHSHFDVEFQTRTVFNVYISQEEVCWSLAV